MSTTDCRVCGGEGWLPADDEAANRQRPAGDSTCPYCDGTGREPEEANR